MWPQLLEQVPDTEACAFIHRCAHRLRALTLSRGSAGPQAPAPGTPTALASLRRALVAVQVHKREWRGAGVGLLTAGSSASRRSLATGQHDGRSEVRWQLWGRSSEATCPTS